MTEKKEAAAEVERIATGWHLVTFGSWQVSISPDGLLMLPRHVKPSEVEEFVGACLAAAEVGAQVQAENAERGSKDDRSRPSRAVMTTTGGVPPGYTRVPTVAGQNGRTVDRGSIGRRDQRGRRAAIQQSNQGRRVRAPAPPRAIGPKE